VYASASAGHSPYAGAVARSVYLKDFVDDLKDLGPSGFRASYPQPVLAWVGLVGVLEDGKGPRNRPTTQMEGTALLANLELARLVNQVWLLTKDRGGRGSEITAGRAATNDLVIPEYSISQHHCHFQIKVNRVVEPRTRQLFIHDLGSLNGTAVRGGQIEAGTDVELNAGDTLALGRLRFVVLSPDEFLVRVARTAGIELE